MKNIFRRLNPLALCFFAMAVFFASIGSYFFFASWSTDMSEINSYAVLFIICMVPMGILWNVGIACMDKKESKTLYLKEA